MSTIANLDVNVRLMTQNLVAGIGFIQKRFSYLENFLGLSASRIYSRFGSLSVLGRFMNGLVPAEALYGLSRLTQMTDGFASAAISLGYVLSYTLRPAVRKLGGGFLELGFQFGKLNFKIVNALAYAPMFALSNWGKAMNVLARSSLTLSGMFTNLGNSLRILATTPTRALFHLREALKGIGQGLVGLSALALEAGVAWTVMGVKAMKEMTHVQRTAENLGVSPTFLAGLQYKSKLEPEELERLVREFERNVAGMTNKNKTVQKAFAQLGVNGFELTKMGGEEGIYRLADAFSEVGNEVENAGLKMELFGRRGVQAEQLFKGGSKAIKAAIDEAVKSGYAFDYSEGNEVARAQYALKEMKYTWEGLGRTAAITIAPLVRAFADAMKGMLQKLTQWKPYIVMWARWFEFAIARQTDVFKYHWTQVKFWFKDMWFEALVWVAKKFNSMFEPINKALQMVHGMAGMEAPQLQMRVDATGLAETYAEMQELKNRLQKQFEDFVAEKMEPLKDRSLTPPEHRENKAAIRGSEEAFRVIVGQEDTMKSVYRVASQQLAEQKGIRRAIERLNRPGKPPPDVRRARI